MSETQDKPKKRRVPIGLPIAAVVFLLLGIFAGPAITNSFSEEQLNRTALLSGISFLLIFISIILFYISFIWWLALRLNDRIPYKIYRVIEYIFIGGIVLGIIGMFQPWVFIMFRYGFYLLTFSTLAFIAWSHVSPAPEEDELAAEIGN